MYETDRMVTQDTINRLNEDSLRSLDLNRVDMPYKAAETPCMFSVLQKHGVNCFLKQILIFACGTESILRGAKENLMKHTSLSNVR